MPRYNFWGWLEGRSRSRDFEEWVERQPKPPVHFESVTNVAAPPGDGDVEPKAFYQVSRGPAPKWALFRCPCGCSSVITLSLQPAHRPSWSVRLEASGRPSVRPSVWRDVGCNSHFWIADGRVYWCEDTGETPWQSMRR